MENTIYLIRHGETNWNKERRFQGQKDVPLNDMGKQQAAKLANRLIASQVSIDAIFSSDLHRAKETADFLAKKYHLEVHTHPGLRERSFGMLEGIVIEEIKKKYPNLDLNDLDRERSMEVEPFLQFKKRVYQTVKEISESKQRSNIVIVSHGAAINSFLHEISNGDLGPGKTRIKNTSVTTVHHSQQDSAWRVLEVNNFSHIEAI